MIDVPRSYTASSERDFVLSACRAEFREHLPKDLEFYTLTLQVKDDQWGGMYLDYKAQSVVDRAVFKLVAVPRMVSLFRKLYVPFNVLYTLQGVSDSSSCYGHDSNDASTSYFSSTRKKVRDGVHFDVILVQVSAGLHVCGCCYFGCTIVC